MPRDDLSIDFVKKMAPSAEAQDPAAILEDFIHRTANLPEEIRFIQDEIADKDRSYNECVKTIEECDTKIQRWIRMNSSHAPFPREQPLRETIRENYARADKLAVEKIALAHKAQTLFDKHLRHLDLQIKQLSDRNEPGFTDPDEIPSVVRPSAANNSNTSLRVLAVTAAQNNSPLNPISANTASARPPNPQIRTTQSQAHISSSAPTSPAASMIMHSRNQRESSAGPGSGVPKRGPRLSSGLMGSLPAASSALARHSSLGPGTPKAGTPGATAGRAGSAGPGRGTSKAGGAGGTGRKGTPSAAGPSRKKPPSTKSTLSRVKRAGGVSKGSPASTADSELSDAESVRSSRAGSRGGSGTPAPRPRPHHGHGHGHGHAHHKRHSIGDVEMGSGGSGGSDDDEDEEGKKYCLCQHVSYGDMVACDNPNCPYEWFHWTCVGLKSEPEGRWYCPACTESMKKKTK
ncbi:inhibitor of growth proteins N-terminal histone-binding-domain-containing protein [Hypoxylon cercidicola]|nr:inhibitor of growth proteins N-terminal histone-binding-domain-containing protein [Hypoxylon cercidicola]